MIDYEEKEDADVRRELGLRPIAHRDTQEKGCHPDQRPCPSWCWVGQSDEYDHEIDPLLPLVARHSSAREVAVALSLYRAAHQRKSADGWVSMATLEARLEQWGLGQPVIRVAMRAEGAGRAPQTGTGIDDFDPERLRLSVDDAKELVTVLQHMIGLAERT